MKTTFFARRSLLILMAVVFLTPFALRGARLAVERTKNDVKDWLPSGFAETRELDWFRNNFLGEQFVLVSWEGCTADDPRLALFTEKLFPHGQPQIGQERELDAGEKVGNRFMLYTVGDYFENWGGRNERWLKGEHQWYYLLPNGELYRWDDGGSLFTGVKHLLGVQIQGELVETLDPSYYKYPHRATAPLFKTVTTGPQLLADLVKEGGVLQNNPDEAVARLKGILFGPDGKQTCLVVTLTEAAKKNLHSTVGRGLLGKPRGRILTLAEQCGIAEGQLRLGGPPVDNVAIDEEGTITLVRLVGLCIVLGLGLAYLCLRSIPATLMVFFVGGCSAVMSLSFVWWLGGSVDAIMMSMPALIYVLGISGAVHIVNYYREALDHNGPVGAPESAVKHGWKPAVLCSTTTALGLLSLYTSDILPIRKFGLFSAIGVMATVILLFTFLPAALQIWPMKPRKQTSGDEQTWLERQLAGFWERLGSFIIGHHRLVAISCVLLVFGVGWGCFRMKTSVQLIKMFDGGSKIIQDYQWLEANVGKLVPMELVVRVDPEILRPPSADQEADAAQDPKSQFQLTFLERMEISDRVQKVIEREFGEQGQQVVGQTMSAVTFAPKLPSAGGGFMAFAERGATNRRLEAHREEFLHSDYLRIDPANQAELWRISIRLGAFNDVDYGQFVGVLKSSVEPVLAAYTQRNAILHSILDENQAAQVSGASVLIVGAPFGLTPAARQALTNEQLQALKEKVQAAQAAIVPGSPEADLAQQTRTFTSTLYELLRNARLRVDWHDPALESVPADFAARVGNYDCVVLVGDSDAYDFAAIGKHAKRVIDARGLHFDPTAAIANDANKPTPVVSAVYTGVVPVVYKAQRTLLESLVQSTFWSFVTITPIMMFVTRGFLSGSVAMLPNIAPVFLIFGAMGWLGIEVDIGSMMTASIALGVAVDDTIHYLNWFRAEMAKGLSRHAAILVAYRHCATPTFQTSVISGVGLSIFAASTFTPTQRFGYLMLTILLMGMFAELIFFPALLAGPLGRVFEPRRPKTPPSDNSTAHGLKLVTVEEGEPAAAVVAAASPPPVASGPHRPLAPKYAARRHLE